MKIQTKKATIHDFPFIDVKTQNDPFKVVREHRSKMKSQLITPSTFQDSYINLIEGG